MDKVYLSVIIPCYNEERNIRLGALENVAHFLGKKKYKYEVLIVDDGSGDQSVKLLKAFISEYPNFKLITKKHQGKAATVMAGVSVAKGNYVLFTDLDQATPINQVDKLMPFFSSGYDLVIGSRSSQRRGAPLMRLAMARGFMLLRNLLLDLGIKDTQCGFKIFSKEAAFHIFPLLKVHNLSKIATGSTVTAGFDVEVLYIAKQLGYKIAEVPVEWYYQETRHVSPLKDSFSSLADLIKIRYNAMRGLYKRLDSPN